MKTSAIEVHDMLSVFSVDEVEKRIGDVPGVASVTVNFAAGNATVRYDETQLEATGIKAAVRQRGFEPAAAAASPVATATDGSAAPDPSAAPPTPASSSAEPDAEPAASAGDGKHDKAATDKG